MAARPLAALVVLFASGCVTGSGVPAEETRDLGDFAELRAGSFVDVTVLAGEVRPARLTCDDNLLSHVRTTNETGVLEVAGPLGRLIQPNTDCRLTAHTGSLSLIRATGAGSVQASGPFQGFREIASHGGGRVVVDDPSGGTIRLVTRGSGGVRAARLDAEEVLVEATGSGRVEATGTAPVVHVAADGAADVDLSALVADEVRVDASGTGQVQVHATGFAVVRLAGSGDVVVSGGAEVDEVVTGTGRVVLLP